MNSKRLLLLVLGCEKFKTKALADLVLYKVVIFGLDDRAFLLCPHGVGQERAKQFSGLSVIRALIPSVTALSSRSDLPVTSAGEHGGREDLDFLIPKSPFSSDFPKFLLTLLIS